MRVRLAQGPDRHHQDVYDKIEKAFTQVAGREEAIDRVLLRDDNGACWSVTVTTAGALTVAAISGKTRDV